MKQNFSKRAIFIGKSLLWSVMIYAGCMIAINWDDLSLSVKGKQPVSAIAHAITQPPVIPPVVKADEPVPGHNITSALPVLDVARTVLIQVVHIISGK